MALGHRERLIGKAIEHGVESFKEHEIMELYLFTVIPRLDTNPIAHDLIRRFGSFYNACNAPLEELLKIKGIGLRAAQQLKLFPQISRAYQLSRYGSNVRFHAMEDIGSYCVDLLGARVNEAMYVLCLDAKNGLVKQALVAEGTPSEVYVEPRQIVEHVLYSSTSSVILTHNHPGGTLMPSQNDIETTQRIKQALDAIGVRLLDHIIVAGDSYVSFNQKNVRL